MSSTVHDNNTMHSGGGIVSSGGTVKVVQSIISANYATESGGGIAIYSGSTVTLINSTVSGNGAGDAVGEGGGLDNAGGTLAVYSSTVTGNEGGTGGIVGSATLANTIVDMNTHTYGGTSDCYGTLTSRGYNLIGTTSNCTITGDATGNLLDVNANLGSLQNNGGATLTHALHATSRAVDAGNPATPSVTLPACPTKDQRNVTRPRDGNGDGVARCDMGAVER
jgi:parallel beta-helix repeat protein